MPPEKCNTCHCQIGTDGCDFQSLKNRRWLATLDDDGNVIAECCEQCAAELESEAEGDDALAV